MKQKNFFIVYIVIVIIIIVSAFFILKNQISGESKTNIDQTVKDKLFVNMLDSLYGGKPDSAIVYTRKLLGNDTILKNLNLYNLLIARVGFYKCQKGEVDSGLFYFFKALNYWKNDTSLLGQGYYGALLNNVAYNYWYMGENEKALSYFKDASIIADKNSDYFLSINVNLQLSGLYQSNGEYIKALECIDKTIQLCYQKKDSVSMISALQSYADLYTNCFLFDEALSQFDDVLNYKDHFTSYSRFCFFNGRGRMFYLKGDYSKAKDEFQEALNATSKNDIYELLIPSSNLAETSLLLGEVDSAKVFLDVLEKNYESVNAFPLLKFNYHSLLGEYYRIKGQYLLSQRSFAISDSINKKTDIDKVILKLHKKRRARFYEATNRFKEAYTEMNEYNSLNESILEQNNRNQVAGLKYKFQRDTTIIQQRNYITLSKQKIETLNYRQTIFIISVIALLLLLLLSYLYFKKRRDLNHEKTIRKIAAMKMENIRGRISPHFVFNVLNNIWAIIDERENARAQFDNLVNLIRRSLVNTENLAIPLNEEIDFVRSFIELQKLTMNNDLEVIWNIESGIDITQLVPGMILQIPVENAIKHGLAPKKENRVLTIEITTITGFLQFIIADNGIGLQQVPSLTQGTGTGLKVLTNTIHILNQINEKKMTYEILDRVEEGVSGIKVLIKIPLLYSYNLN